MFKGGRSAKAVWEHFDKVQRNVTLIMILLFFLCKSNTSNLSIQ